MSGAPCGRRTPRVATTHRNGRISTETSISASWIRQVLKEKADDFPNVTVTNPLFVGN